jgi:hypothetical protein
MPDVSAYHLYVQRYAKILIFGMLGVFTIMGLLFFSGVLQSSNGDGPPRVVGIFWLGIIGWYWYWVLSMPHTITVSESGNVEFISVIRTRRTTLREIESIKPYSSQFGFLIVKAGSGKIRLLNQFDGFHDFILRLKSANPAVELRGC